MLSAGHLESLQGNGTATWRLDVGQLAGLKIMASEMAVAVAHMAIQVCGGVAYRRGHVTERCYRDARAGSLMAPSDDTLKVIMGNQLLGTPQPWA